MGTVKYEEVYLKAYQNGKEARIGISDYFRFYKYGANPTRHWVIGHREMYLPQPHLKTPKTV